VSDETNDDRGDTEGLATGQDPTPAGSGAADDAPSAQPVPSPSPGVRLTKPEPPPAPPPGVSLTKSAAPTAPEVPTPPPPPVSLAKLATRPLPTPPSPPAPPATPVPIPPPAAPAATVPTPAPDPSAATSPVPPPSRPDAWAEEEAADPSPPPVASPPPPAPPTPAGNERSRSGQPAFSPALVIMSVALVAALVLVAVLAVGRNGNSSNVAATTTPEFTVPATAEAPGTEPDTTWSEPVPTTSETPTPTEDPEQAALDQLELLRDQDVQTVSLNGQWVVQLASKVPGIIDPLQTTQSGSHQFTAVDILTEHLSLRNGDNLGATVILLKSTDYGKRQTYQGQALWVTFAEDGFSSAAQVRAWCTRRFPTLTGDSFIDACTPRQLKSFS